MKPTMIVGLILTILGVGLLFWQGVAFFTTREAVAQAGPFTVFTVQHAVWLGPVIGGVVLAVGIVLLLVGAAKRAG